MAKGNSGAASVDPKDLVQSQAFRDEISKVQAANPVPSDPFPVPLTEKDRQEALDVARRWLNPYTGHGRLTAEYLLARALVDAERRVAESMREKAGPGSLRGNRQEGKGG